MTTKLSVQDEALPSPLLSSAQWAGLEIGVELGKGESARVVSATLPSGREVALKIAHPGKEGVLLREARALALSVGEHSPRLLGISTGVQEARLCLAMELIVGRSLGEILRDQVTGPDSMLLAAQVLTQIGGVLRQLHALGFAHGDVKPDNIMVTESEELQVALIDFGLASEEPLVVGGTPHYLPPEVLSGAVLRTTVADAYALALTVGEIFLPVLRVAPPSEELLLQLPQVFQSILGPFLVPQGRPRPGVRFLLDEAQNQGVSSSIPTSAELLSAVRREYLATRLQEIESEESLDFQIEGRPNKWAQELHEQLAAIRKYSETGTEGAGKASTGKTIASLPNLSAHDRRRFLGRLIGPAASAWRLPIFSDEELIERLVLRSKNKGLRSLIAADFLFQSAEIPVLGGQEELGSTRKQKENALEWAIRLGRRPVAHELLETLANTEELAEALSLEAARAARQGGDLVLARRLLHKCSSPEAGLERAIILARGGDISSAQAMVLSLMEGSLSPLLAARARAFCARALVDQGQADSALSSLEQSSACPEVCEVQALAYLKKGHFESALFCLDRGDSLAGSDEELARLMGVRGMLQHGRGQPSEALKSFHRATELASSAGAALEEATYCTGVAAAASDSGRLGVALSASERAGELFESLDKPAHNARALLARSSVLASLGAAHELGAVVRRGLLLARQSGDIPCEAYLLLCLCDGTSDLAEARRAARRAHALLASSSKEDKLRAAARLLSTTGHVDLPGDEWASAGVQAETSFDWWRARAEILEKTSYHGPNSEAWASAQVVISSLRDLSTQGIHLSAAGPALVAGAHLALRVGMAEDARGLLSRGSECAAHFLKNVPEEYRARAERLTWVQQAQGSRLTAGSGAAQLGDVEALLRALSQRQGFRSLLNQILDMLLLWTGVERGLLLLRAPGDKLVIRAGRNLDKRELSAEQRALSLSMAKRALSEGRPVVAVDAMQDVSALHKSVHALNLRSVLAVPLVARGEIMGVAYLDDRVRRGAFGEREMSWVQLIGTVAAVAIADERDRLLLKRALRRAEGAERRLGKKLDSSEAELEVAERQLSSLRDERPLRGDYSHIIAQSRPMAKLLALVDKVAHSEVPVLIQGESGTGKELIARAIAASGSRKSQSFVAENCGAVPEALAESTFFGHQKGSFTGAVRNQSGLFDLAHRGTLFLDEIGEMSPAMQTKLLRVLQEGELRPLGAERPHRVDVRVLVATHQNLKDLVERGLFREDLYYRLKVVSLEVPPLRKRPEDIPLLLDHFLNQYSPDEARHLSRAALYRLTDYPWPGNVRQLENEVRRMLVLGEGELTAADLSPEVMKDSHDLPTASTLKEKVNKLERRLVVEALEQAKGNRTRAAEALGLSRFGLQKMTQRLSIDVNRGA